MIGNNGISSGRVFEWHTRFSEGKEEIEYDEYPGSTVTARAIGKVKKN